MQECDLFDALDAVTGHADTSVKVDQVGAAREHLNGLGDDEKKTVYMEYARQRHLREEQESHDAKTAKAAFDKLAASGFTVPKLKFG